VCVSGCFDYRVYESFKASYQALPEDSPCISVDLTETDYLDSSALGMLLMLREHFGRAADILLVNPRPDVLRVLAVANFDKLFSIRRSDDN